MRKITIYIRHILITFCFTFCISLFTYAQESRDLAVGQPQAVLDELIDANAKVEKVATGFQFTEGPVWHPENYLL